MRQTFAQLASLAFFIAWAGRIFAADPQPNSDDTQTKQLQFYPWSENAEFARIPKTLLNELTIPTVTVTNSESMQFGLTSEFIEAFRLTPLEAERVTRAIAEALHEYRTVKGKHFQPTDEVPNARRRPMPTGWPVAAEKFNFRLIPFPEEAMAIRRKFEDVILATLGDERARHFWENGGRILGSETSTFTKKDQLRPGVTVTTIHTFSLRSSNPGAGTVDWTETTTTSDGSHSSGGRPYGEPLDQYAPESLKPVLARWRKETAAAKVGPEKQNSVRPIKAPQFSATRWKDEDIFVDLPKSLIRSLRITGLTQESHISPEAITLFGLTVEDRKAVQELYETMKLRFEKLEREHFARVEPGKNSFVLKAFPEKSAALKEEWTKKLKALVGQDRGGMLDQSIRSGATAFQLSKSYTRTGRIPIQFDRESYPDWLQRGTAETRINITIGPGRDGQPAIIQLEHQTEGGARGSGGVPRGQIPERWRHLITPDMLGLPLTL